MVRNIFGSKNMYAFCQTARVIFIVIQCLSLISLVKAKAFPPDKLAAEPIEISGRDSTVTSTFSGHNAAKATAKMEFQFGSHKEMQTMNTVIYGNFSASGSLQRASIQGFVVQMNPMRPCQMDPKGLDRTLSGHIALVFMDEVEPFLRGCVSADNQVKFAYDSLASGIILAAFKENTILKTYNIPVVTLDKKQTVKLRRILLGEKHSEALSVHVVASWNFNREVSGGHPQDEHFSPSVFDVGIILALLILILFASVVIFIKFKWRPQTHREVTLRAVAKNTLNGMEVRKFRAKSRRERKQGHSRHRSEWLVDASSLYESKHSVITQDSCAICLEDYRDGQELRVLPCAHEFHKGLHTN